MNFFSPRGVVMKRFLLVDLSVLAAVTVFAVPSANVTAATIVRTIAAGSDDAEEALDPAAEAGNVSLTSSDIELSSDGPPNDRQWAGLRFTDLGIPRGAPITSAHIQFTVDSTDEEPDTDVRVYGELAPNSATFTEAPFNITSRPRTTSSVLWNDIPVWTVVGEAGAAQRTPNLASIIQEIVNQPGWAAGNALTLLLAPDPITDGADERTAGSFETDVAGSAPARLTVEFVPEPSSCVLVAVAAFAISLAARRRG
jgi:hypothetical protein